MFNSLVYSYIYMVMVLTPLLTIFQLYRGSQLYWWSTWRKPL